MSFNNMAWTSQHHVSLVSVASFLTHNPGFDLESSDSLIWPLESATPASEKQYDWAGGRYMTIILI